MHLIGGGLYMGAQFGVKVKTGHKLKSLDPAANEPLLKEACYSTYDLMDIDPESWIGKVLNFAGNIDERYLPIIALISHTKDLMGAELEEIAAAQAEKKKRQKAPIGNDSPDRRHTRPIETPNVSQQEPIENWTPPEEVARPAMKVVQP